MKQIKRWPRKESVIVSHLTFASSFLNGSHNSSQRLKLRSNHISSRGCNLSQLRYAKSSSNTHRDQCHASTSQVARRSYDRVKWPAPCNYYGDLPSCWTREQWNGWKSQCCSQLSFTIHERNTTHHFHQCCLACEAVKVEQLSWFGVVLYHTKPSDSWGDWKRSYDVFQKVPKSLEVNATNVWRRIDD